MTVVEVLIWGRDFCKLKFHGLYALELTAIFLIPFSFPISYMAALFFIFGLCRWMAGQELAGLQHCLLFVYPVVWIGIGYKFKHLKSIAFVLLGVALTYAFLMRLTPNISVGPIVVIPAMYYLTKNNWKAGPYTLLAFLPFWAQWQNSFQRTTLLELLFSIAFIPMIVRPGLRAFGVSLVALLIFVTGLYLTSPVPVKQQVSVTLKHGDDTGPGPTIKARFRKELWNDAFQVFKENPIVGAGYKVSISPDYMAPPGEPPLSGPHNSFLSILARNGVIGFLIFLLIPLAWANGAMRVEIYLRSLLLIFIPIYGFIYAFFNVGLESPQNCMIMWLCVGMLTPGNYFLGKRQRT